MTDKNLSAHQLIARELPASAMVQELMQRGALRLYGIRQYVPGIVRRRHMETNDMDDTAFARVVTAASLNSLTSHMVAEQIISFGAQRPDDQDAPPGDMVYTADVLTLDPRYTLEDIDAGVFDYD